jgi:translocation and assembly module TamA
MHRIIKITFFILLLSLSYLFSIPYNVKFIGIKDKKTLKTLRSTSLITSKISPPRTVNALRYRVSNSIEEMIKILHNYGYYDANITFDLEEEKKTINVFIFCKTGPRYILDSYDIYLYPCNEKCIKVKNIDYKKIGLTLKKPTTSKEIINAKYKILRILMENGHPLSSIEKHKVIVDVKKKTISVEVFVKKSPLCRFGPTTISGLKNIYPKYIYNKIAWREKNVFSPEKIKETQTRLINTNLFSSVIITYKEKLDEENLLPMNIDTVEAKHQNFSIGANYATVDGFGVVFGWNHYNVRRMGEILSLYGDVSKRATTGYLTYKKPDFLWFDQTLVLRGYATREKIRAYLGFTYGGLFRIDHKVHKKFKYSYGLQSEYVSVVHSANSGKFTLIGIPFYFRYMGSNHLLNPTKGFNLTYVITPFYNAINEKTFFTRQRFVWESYLPTKKNKKIVFAFRFQIGSILGSSIFKIPMTKLFLGGSDDDLRGYRYKTVSPRNNQGKIIGGKSAIYASFEPRFRVTKAIGVVPFVDIGNVQLKSFPSLRGKWRKSVGMGLRYFTFFGPLRLDVGFPLDKYKKDDPSYRIYVSIGQTF